MRVVIGEDEVLMRQGLSMVMAAGGLTVVGVAPDAPTLVRLVEEHEPDLVISDIRMPPTGTDDGLRAVIRLRRSRPGLPVIVLSHHVQRQYAAELLAAGPTGVGYLLKHRVADIDAFVDQVRRVHDGGTVLDPEVVATMVERARRTTRPIDALSPRQREVLALVAEGRSNAAIGRRLNITERTVVQHVSVVYDRLGIVETDDDHRRVLAVLAFLTDGPGDRLSGPPGGTASDPGPML